MGGLYIKVVSVIYRIDNVFVRLYFMVAVHRKAFLVEVFFFV